MSWLAERLYVFRERLCCCNKFVDLLFCNNYSLKIQYLISLVTIFQDETILQKLYAGRVKQICRPRCENPCLKISFSRKNYKQCCLILTVQSGSKLYSAYCTLGTLNVLLLFSGKMVQSGELVQRLHFRLVFECWSGHQLLWLRHFIVCLYSSRQMLDIILR
jgi:hypothetical protein